MCSVPDLKGGRMRIFSFGVGVVLLVSVESARAQEPEAPPDEPAKGLPISSSERPLTLPELTLRLDASGGDYHIDFGLFGDVDVGYLQLGLGFGILDDLEIDAVIVPLFINPDSDDTKLLYGNPFLGVTYRFLNLDPV